MQLRRLAALERRKLQDEYQGTIALIRSWKRSSPRPKCWRLSREPAHLKARYGDARRTQIADRVKGTLTTMDVLPDEDVWVGLSADGILARHRRGVGEFESGRKGVSLPFKPAPMLIIPAKRGHDLYLFSAKGQAARVHAHQIPEAPGAHYADISGPSSRPHRGDAFVLP